jgi:hypothetical protein
MNSSVVHHAGRVLRWASMVCLTGVAISSAAAAPQAQSSQSSSESAVNQPQAAVWQAYELQFHYFAAHTYYSCSGLENRLEAMLRQLGAAKDINVMVTGCFGTADVGNMLSARIKTRMPAAAGEAPSDSFQATSKLVVLRSGRAGDNAGGDCELLEQVRDQILPALKLKLVKDDLNCVPGMANSPSRSLQVMALLPELSKP